MADEIKIHAPKVEQSIEIKIEGERELERFSNTINRMARGTKLQDYWKSEEALIKDVTNAYTTYQKTVSNFDATQLIRSFNALQAKVGNTDLSGLLKGFDDISVTVEKAFKQVGHVGDYTKESFQDFYRSIETMEAMGLDLKEFFSKFSVSANTEELQASLRAVNEMLSTTKAQLADTQSELTSLKAGTGVVELEQQLATANDQLEELRSKMRDEFNAFLQGNDIIGVGEDGWWRFSEYFEQISDGSMTAKEAIARFKSEYQHLFEGRDSAGVFSTEQVSEFIFKLEEIYTRVEEISSYIRSMDSSKIFTGLTQQLSESTELTEAQRAKMVELASTSGSVHSVLDILKEIINATMNVDEGMSKSMTEINALVQSIQSLSTVDAGNLKSIEAMFTSISRMHNLSVDKSSVQNLVSTIDAISKIGNATNLNVLSNVNFSAFNELKVRKASLANLAEYLPAIASVNVVGLKNLAEIDFSNLNNIHVSKASVNNLQELTNQIQSFMQMWLNAKEIAKEPIQPPGSGGLGTVPPGGDNGGGGSNNNSDLYLRTLRESQRANSLLHRNKANIVDTDAYSNLTTVLKQVDELLLACEGDSEKFGNMMSEFGFESEEALQRVLDKLREYYTSSQQELTKFEAGGFVKNETLINKYNQAQKLLNRSSALSDTEAYRALETTFNNLAPVIEQCKNGSINLEQALRDVGIDGSTVIKDLTVQMGQLNREINTQMTSPSAAIENMQAQMSRSLKAVNSIQSSDDRAALITNSEYGYDAIIQKLSQLNALSDEQKAKEIGNIQEIINKYFSEIETIKEVELRKKALDELGSSKSELINIDAVNGSYTRQLNLLKQIQHYEQVNTKMYGTAEHNNIKNMIAELQSGRLDSTRIKSISEEFKTAQIRINEAGLAGKSFNDVIASGIKKFSSWFGVSQLVMRSIMAIRKMITMVTELDTAMTELKKVTDLTEEAYENFGRTAANIAQNTGAKITDTINAAAEFARLGYDIDESTKLAQAALVYKNVGDGIENISDASESIISTVKAFGVEANDAMSIVDKFNEVGNNYAISSEGIGTALKKSAAALAASGNSIEESIGLATAMNSVVQNPEQVGTSLKTLTTYLRAAKVEAEEAGEETEGMANSISELRSKILTLTNNKVDIMLDKENFKSTYQIISDISKVWEEMDDIDQAALLKLIAGKRNANVVTSLITNFKDAEKAMQSAIEADGSATKENEKYLNSIEGKKAQLAAVTEDLSQGLFTDDSLKTAISALTTILDIVNKITHVAGALPAIIGAVGGALSLKGVGELIKQFHC